MTGHISREKRNRLSSIEPVKTLNVSFLCRPRTNYATRITCGPHPRCFVREFHGCITMCYQKKERERERGPSSLKILQFEITRGICVSPAKMFYLETNARWSDIPFAQDNLGRKRRTPMVLSVPRFRRVHDLIWGFRITARSPERERERMSLCLMIVFRRNRRSLSEFSVCENERRVTHAPLVRSGAAPTFPRDEKFSSRGSRFRGRFDPTPESRLISHQLGHA